MALDHNQISDYRRRRGSGFRGRQTQRQAGRFGCGITVGDDSGADLVARRNALDRKSGESRLVYVLVRGADTSDVFNISDVAAPNRLLAFLSNEHPQNGASVTLASFAVPVVWAQFRAVQDTFELFP